MSFFINTLPALIAIIFLVVAVGRAIIKVLKEYERGVIFTLGKVSLARGIKGPGLILLFPVVQKMVKVDLRTVTMDVPPQDIVTKDNVTVKVNAVVYFRVVEPRKAILEVADYYYATSQIAQTTLRSILGQSSLDDLLSKRDEINASLQKIIDLQTEPWGIKVSVVEVKNVDLPIEMQRALAKQAEAERERRAKIIHAEGGVSGGPEAHGRGRDHRDGAHGHPAEVPPDAHGGRRRQELDDRLPDPHRPLQAVPGEGEGREVTADGQSEKDNPGQGRTVAPGDFRSLRGRSRGNPVRRPAGHTLR